MKNMLAVEVCRPFFLGAVAKNLLSDRVNAEEYVQTLVQNKQYIDAIRVLAYALPVRKAIHWARFCALHFSATNPSEVSSATLDAVTDWLGNPDDNKRRALMDAAKLSGFDSPAGSVALAVYFSGGNIAPPDGPVVEPPQSLTPNSVVNAVLLAALLKDPEKSEEKYQLYLAEGLKIASEN